MEIAHCRNGERGDAVEVFVSPLLKIVQFAALCRRDGPVNLLVDEREPTSIYRLGPFLTGIRYRRVRLRRKLISRHDDVDSVRAGMFDCDRLISGAIQFRNEVLGKRSHGAGILPRKNFNETRFLAIPTPSLLAGRLGQSCHQRQLGWPSIRQVFRITRSRTTRNRETGVVNTSTEVA